MLKLKKIRGLYPRPPFLAQHLYGARRVALPLISPQNCLRSHFGPDFSKVILGLMVISLPPLPSFWCPGHTPNPLPNSNSPLVFGLTSEFHKTKWSAETSNGNLFQIIFSPKTALRTHQNTSNCLSKSKISWGSHPTPPS